MSSTKFIFIFFLLFFASSLISCSKRTVKPSECMKNSTDQIHYPPFFKTSTICIDNKSYFLRPLGDDFQFSCNYQSNPPSSLHWFKLNKTTGIFNQIGPINSTNLVIKSLNLEDDGQYVCLVENSLGSIEHQFYLHVNDKPLVHPIFNHKDEEFTSSIGGKVKLDCSYKTSESSNLNFYKANDLMNFTYKELVQLNDVKNQADNVLFSINSTFIFNRLDHNLISPQSPHSLVLENLTDNQFGVYMCIAENRYGKELKFVNLKKKKPEYNFIIILYAVTSIIIILIILLIFQAYLRNKDRKKMYLASKQFCITANKIIVDYVEAKEPSEEQMKNLLQIHDPSEMNIYKNFPCRPLIPRISIIKESKAIIGKTEAELDQSDFYEIQADFNWDIDSDRLVLDKEIGSGNFGIVQRALLYEKPQKKKVEKKITYSNDDVYLKNKDDAKIKDEKSDDSKLNYTSIIDHFKNNSLNKNITAFSNDCYALFSSQFEEQSAKVDEYIDFTECYGRFGFTNSDDKNEKEIQKLDDQNVQMVAVKRLKSDFKEDDVKNFVLEMVSMKLNGNHENIINLLGCCTKKGPLFLVMELAEKGNLKNFLTDYKLNNCFIPSSLPARRLHSKDLISFALQIAYGMQHLALSHCIHRDLAARNVLVTADLVMKVADFGLSRSIVDSEYYRKSSDSHVPIRWLAPECLTDNFYSVASDVSIGFSTKFVHLNNFFPLNL